jgi:hypothetical protein
MIDYAKLAILAAVFFAGSSVGWYFPHRALVEYKASVEAAAKAQEAHVESITKQQTLVTKGIQDEYDAKLAAVRNYYKSTSVWNNNGSSTLPGISVAPKSTDVIASYNELAGQCAATTLQLVELQKWINEQIGIK